MAAGYSGTPLPTKLGIKPGAALLLDQAPAGFAKTLGPLPVDTVQRAPERPGTGLDVVLAFATTRAALDRALAVYRPLLAPSGGLWIAWPKRASGVATELTEDVVRVAGLAAGLVDNKVCAIDATWSGLRLVIRLRDR